MAHFCAVKSCRRSSRNNYLHVFTRREPAYQQWLAAVNRPDLYAKPKKTVCSSAYICDLHFAASCKFPRTKKTNLKVGSVPTLFLDNPAPESGPVLKTPTTSIDYPITEIMIADRPITYRGKRQQIEEDEHPFRFTQQDKDPLRISPEPAVVREKPLDPRCRVCLTKTDNAIPLNHSTNINEESRTLCEILNKCSKVKIAIDDKKPQLLCIDCVEKARIAYEFIVRCESSESVLQKDLENAEEQDSHDVICVIDVSEFAKPDGTCKTSQKPTTSPIKNGSLDPSKRVIVSYSTEKSTINTKCEKSVNTTPIKNSPCGPSKTVIEKATVDKKCEKSVSKECACMKKGYSAKDDKRKSMTTLCVQCCRNFSSRASFKFYTNVLIGKKRYRCLKCGARFGSARNLRLHVVSHKEVLS